MFFMIGISSGRKDLGTITMTICAGCGAYGHYEIFMTYSQLLLFFIPCLKWNKRYFARSSCCNSLFEIEPDLGKRIERGEDIILKPSDLRACGNGGFRYTSSELVCDQCGYSTVEDYTYCPKCGNRLRRS